MSQNWICSKCKAYNPPRRQACWQCGHSPAKDASHTSQRLSLGSPLGKFILVIGIAIILTCIVFLINHLFFTTPTTHYELIWKIEEDQPIAYNVTMGLFGSNILSSTWPIFSILEKNPHGDISVQIVADLTEQNQDDLSAQWLNQLMQGVENISLLSGEITPEGKVASFYLAQEQKNILALFFELPGRPVKVGDAWPIDFNCIALKDSLFAELTINNSEQANQVTFAEITETPSGEQVAVLDYSIIESVEGKLTPYQPFSATEPVSISVKCSFIGRGHFSISQGRWKQFSGEWSTQTSWPTTSELTQPFALTPLDQVPEYSSILETE